MGGVSPRHNSIGDYDQMRPQSGSSLQSFYANQRHQPRQQSEADQMMQAKRRMAAQRERELRNYHQEQQYNRSEFRSINLSFRALLMLTDSKVPLSRASLTVQSAPTP